MSNKFNFHKVELLEHFNDCSKCIELLDAVKEIAKRGVNDF